MESRVSDTIWVLAYLPQCARKDTKGLQPPSYKNNNKSVMKEGYLAGQSDVAIRGR